MVELAKIDLIKLFSKASKTPHELNLMFTELFKTKLKGILFKPMMTSSHSVSSIAEKCQNIKFIFLRK
jgi:hypothetical protein